MAKKALLIGINRYRIPGADLRGCINDVKNLRGALTTHRTPDASAATWSTLTSRSC